MDWRASLLSCLALASLACPDFEPPPDRQIQLFEGGPQGLVFGGPSVTLDDLFEGSADPGDMFGYAMTAGDLNLDGFDELIVGAPGDDSGGFVWVIPGSKTGLLFDELTTIRQGVSPFGGRNEMGDEFGYALTWTIVNHATTGISGSVSASTASAERRSVSATTRPAIAMQSVPAMAGPALSSLAMARPRGSGTVRSRRRPISCARLDISTLRSRWRSAAMIRWMNSP